MRRRAAPAAALALTWALTGGCASPTPRETSARHALPPVVLPDLSPLADSVKRQVRERHASLTQKLGIPSTPRAELAAAYGGLGALLTAAKFSDEAESCYLHAQALAPDDMRWPYYLGHVQLMKGERASAAASFQRAVELRPNDVTAKVWLAETYLDDARPEIAQRVFLEALAIQPQLAAALFGAGRAALALQAYADAVRHFEQTLVTDPRASAVHYPLAMAYRALGDREKADAHLRQRGSVWPDLPDPLRQQPDDVLESSVAYEHRGVRALRDENWVAAAAAFRKGLEIAPGDPTLRYGLGATLLAAGDASGAEKEFVTVVRQSPDFAKAHFSLGMLFVLSARLPAAIEQFSAAVRADPYMPEARFRLGEAQRATGRLQESLVQYAEAVKLDPGMADAWIGGARALIGIERYAQAREWLARARRVHPDRRELEELQARLP